jgi:hypothetical protein
MRCNCDYIWWCINAEVFDRVLVLRGNKKGGLLYISETKISKNLNILNPVFNLISLQAFKGFLKYYFGSKLKQHP